MESNFLIVASCAEASLALEMQVTEPNVYVCSLYFHELHDVDGRCGEMQSHLRWRRVSIIFRTEFGFKKTLTLQWNFKICIVLISDDNDFASPRDVTDFENCYENVIQNPIFLRAWEQENVELEMQVTESDVFVRNLGKLLLNEKESSGKQFIQEFKLDFAKK